MKKEFTLDTFINRMLNSTNNQCPIRKTLEMLSGKWRTQVIEGDIK